MAQVYENQRPAVLFAQFIKFEANLRRQLVVNGISLGHFGIVLEALPKSPPPPHFCQFLLGI
jgi:hypothetical protein